MSTREGDRASGRDGRGAAATGLPSVAIVGVPNVGKSTLFNRLVGRRQALVGHRPGVTRDRIHGEARLGERAVSLTDTGGIFAEAGAGLAELVRAQARLAVAEADAILLMVDGPWDKVARLEDQLGDLGGELGLTVTVLRESFDLESSTLIQRTVMEFLDRDLLPGHLEHFSYSWPLPEEYMDVPLTIRVVADDIGDGTGEHNECEDGGEDNNAEEITGIRCGGPS